MEVLHDPPYGVVKHLGTFLLWKLAEQLRCFGWFGFVIRCWTVLLSLLNYSVREQKHGGISWLLYQKSSPTDWRFVVPNEIMWQSSCVFVLYASVEYIIRLIIKKQTSKEFSDDLNWGDKSSTERSLYDERLLPTVVDILYSPFYSCLVFFQKLVTMPYFTTASHF